MTIKKLTNAQLGALLAQLPMLEAFIKGVKIEAMLALSKDPSSVPGYKVVEGQSRRRWRDPAETIKALKRLGCKEDDYAPRELANMGDVAKLLKPGNRETFMSQHTTKPHGKPTIAPTTDHRPAINGDALMDFADEILDE